MRSIPKLIRRFIFILLLSSFLILLFNFAALIAIGYKQSSSASPWNIAYEISKALSKIENGYTLSRTGIHQLQDKNAWAILIDNNTGKVVWHSENLPLEIPLKYSLSNIATLTRGYVKDYPTFTSGFGDSLVVVGFPKTSYWKSLYNGWDYNFIANLPKILLVVILGNMVVIFIIYMVANTKLIKSINPILQGIRDLPNEKNVHIQEKGVLSEIAININRTSDILQSKNYELKRKETARANWIAGVSHDIRTPLSMVMGYAGQLEADEHLTLDEKQKAGVIRRQSERMKNLINDLNLASKLEYNMQPVNFQKINAVAVVRQVVVDFVNMDIEEKYPIEWLTSEELASCLISGDQALIKRAVINLIQNSINHNENGCSIYVSVSQTEKQCIIKIDDNGIGVTDKQIEKLNNTQHYMVCDENTMEQRHGLGLLIVKQIVYAHHGQVIIDHSTYNGFSVTIMLPI